MTPATQLWIAGNGFVTVNKNNFMAILLLLGAAPTWQESDVMIQALESTRVVWWQAKVSPVVLATGDRLSGSLEHLQFTWISSHQVSRPLPRQPGRIIRHWTQTLWPGGYFIPGPLWSPGPLGDREHYPDLTMSSDPTPDPALWGPGWHMWRHIWQGARARSDLSGDHQ